MCKIFRISVAIMMLLGLAQTAQATTVSLSAPASNAKFAAGSNITLSATATPTAGQALTKVDFYQGTILIASDTTSPYSIVWSAVPIGSYSLTAKATTNTAAVTTSAARTITVAALPTVSLTAPANNAAFAAGSTIALAATAAATGQTITKVDFYRGTTLIRSDTTAPYTASWTGATAGSYSLTAKVTTSLALTATSTVVAVAVAAAPTISLSAPANATTVGAGNNVTLTATAAAIGQTITKVDFYQGTTLLGTSTTSPYSFIWSAVPAGSYSLTAKVTTNLGLVTTSTARTITVAAVPTVSLTTPTNNATATSPASFTLSATTTNVAAQTVGKVDFYNGATLLGTDTTVPYTYTWSNAAVGSYSLTAKVTGSLGSVATSAAANVTVNALPTITLTAPANGTTLGAGGNVTLTANPVALGQTITQVDFYNGATLLGISTNVPYTFTWSNVAAGNYSLTAKVTTNLGLMTTSAASTLNVIAVPTVSLTSPINNATATAPATFTLRANASSTSSVIAKVDFYANNGNTNALIGTATTAPYSYTWNNVPAGNYTITSVATDILSLTATSTGVVVISNQPPTLTLSGTYAQILSPANVTLTTTAAGANGTIAKVDFSNGTTLLGTVNVADADGTIAKVDFYNGTTLLGTLTTAPYNRTWSNFNFPAGNYSLIIKATDNFGAVTTASAVNINVIANVPPAIVLTTPANGDITTTGSFTLTADASSQYSTVNKVEFYANSILVGTATSAPYSHNWTNIPVGTYSLTALAADALGSISISTPISVTVNNGNPLNIVVSSPAPDAIINDDNVLVTGTFLQGATNVGISVNGIVAAQYGNSFYALVPLQTGINALNITATSIANGAFSQTFNVTSTGADAFQIKANTMSGAAPLSVRFTVQDNSGLGIYQAQADFNGDGVFDLTTYDTAQYTYTTPGIYQARFDIEDDTIGNIVTKTFLVVVQDAAQTDQMLKAQWNAMNAALLAGNKQAVMAYLSEDAKLQYGPVFDELMPNFQQVISTWSPLLSSSASGDMFEYAVVTNYNNKRQLFFVHFILGEDGVWRLVSM